MKATAITPTASRASTTMFAVVLAALVTLNLVPAAAQAAAQPASAQAESTPPASAQPVPAPVDLAPYLRRGTYENLKISPKGDYFAATVPLDEGTALVVIRRSDRVPTAKIRGGKDSVVMDFWWANDERVVASLAQKFGIDERLYATGELYAVNADGSRGLSLTGPAIDTYALMYDALRDDDRNVLISVVPYGDNPETSLEKLDVYTGKRSPVSAAPVRDAVFTTDSRGVARFARGSGSDNVSKLYYRERDGGPWRLLNDESVSGVVEAAIGFSAADATAYLRVEHKTGPDSIVAMDIASGKRAELLRDPAVDPYAVVFAIDSDAVVGARYMHDRLRNRFFDPDTPTAKLYRQLEKAFPDDAVGVTSATRDGTQLVVEVGSDRNAGDFYIFDTQAKKVLPLFSRRIWFDPATLPPTRGVRIEARDGLALHGYLTLPAGERAGPSPMVLLPHGGPFGIYDTWFFDDEVHMLAQAGYAVLRVNYRGSGNYGRQFRIAGARQWGLKLQDDLTDATRWAIAQKIAHPDRICLYGASYGAYAALRGLALEPSLYRCAAGYVGVYDMPAFHRDVSAKARWARNWAADWLGPREGMEAISVVDQAGRIKAPVFLAAGGKDEIAPIEHTRKMEKALSAAGVPVETLYYPNEGHGFADEANRREYYRRLLNFLSRHLGGAPAK